MVSIGSGGVDTDDVVDIEDGKTGFSDANVDAIDVAEVGSDGAGSLDTTGPPVSGLMTMMRSGNFLCWMR